MKQYQIRYVVQESEDGVLWHNVADCESEEEAMEEIQGLEEQEQTRRDYELTSFWNDKEQQKTEQYRMENGHGE